MQKNNDNKKAETMTPGECKVFWSKVGPLRQKVSKMSHWLPWFELWVNCDVTTIFVGKALCIHEKLEYSCDVTNKAIPTPSWLVYFVLNAQPFFINFGVSVFDDQPLFPGFKP